jgi:drug/metabolite transporter (DMT)-like permease
MSDHLVTAVVAGLGGMLGWGFADFFAKKTIDRIGEITSLVWAHGLAAGALLLYLLFAVLAHGSEGFPGHTAEWLEVVGFGVLQAAVYILVYKGFAKGKLAILHPIFSSYAGIAALISIIALGEVLSTGLAVALAVIFAGIILSSVDADHLKLGKLKFVGEPGVNVILAATVLAAIWTVYWAQVVADENWKIFASLMYVSMAITMYVYARWQKESLKVSDGSMWKYVVGIGAGEILAYTSISYGFSYSSHVSIIALLSGSASVPAVLLAYLFLKERLTQFQTFAVLVIIAGIAWVSLLSS